MPDTYTGNPVGSHSPSPTPALDHDVQIQVGLDGVDPPNASTLNQPPEVLADWVAFLKVYASTFRGIRLWNSVDTFTAGNEVEDPTDHRSYRALSTNTNKAPHSNLDIWQQCDLSPTEVVTIAAAHTEQASISSNHIACTNGALVPRSNMLKIANDSLRVLMFEVQNITWDSIVQLDMSGSTNKFSSAWYGGLVSLRSAGYTYGGQVGINAPSSGIDVFSIWAKKGAGDPGTLCDVSVLLYGK